MAPIPEASRAAGDMDGRLGFRVPTLLIAPWARRGYVAHGVYDHTSILRLIAWRWGLAPLTVRDATAGNLATALDFKQTDLSAPAITVPVGPFGGPCLSTEEMIVTKWESLRRTMGVAWPGWP